MRMQFSSALAEKVMRSVMSVLPSVCFYYIVVTFYFGFCAGIGHEHSSPDNESQGLKL